jgi:hypothetical protein
MLRAVSQDTEVLELTYAEWLASATEKMKELQDKGIVIQKVDVDIRALVQWCQQEGIPVDGHARASYAANAQVPES